MTYLWSPAMPIEMRFLNHQPTQFVWNTRLHRVGQITKRWRVDVEWWRIRIWRDYYKLVTHTGLLVIVYCDLLDYCWYLQQLFD